MIAMTFVFRRFELAFAYLEHRDMKDISRETGCDKPCKYKKYRLIGGPHRLPDDMSIKDFGLWAITNYTTVDTIQYIPVIKNGDSFFDRFQVETEELIYPWQSLVAEFGGALGLFLGFSLMAIWDSVLQLKFLKFGTNF